MTYMQKFAHMKPTTRVLQKQDSNYWNGIFFKCACLISTLIQKYREKLENLCSVMNIDTQGNNETNARVKIRYKQSYNSLFLFCLPNVKGPY